MITPEWIAGAGIGAAGVAWTVKTLIEIVRLRKNGNGPNSGHSRIVEMQLAALDKHHDERSEEHQQMTNVLVQIVAELKQQPNKLDLMEALKATRHDLYGALDRMQLSIVNQLKKEGR